jgi:hypothetical protein
MILYPMALVRIRTAQALEQVGEILSKRLFGGIPFGPDESGSFEEVPALRLQNDLLGLRVALHGHPGLYILELRETAESVHRDSERDLLIMDISNYVIHAIGFVDAWRMDVPGG